MGIYKKIQEVMKEVKGVEKSARNNHAGYNYAGHESVTEALRGKFVDFGIVRQASVLSCEVLPDAVVKVMVRITYVDVDDEQSKIEIDMPALQHAQTKAKSLTAQQVGQAISYAVKNCEFKLFALTGDTEPDSDASPGEYDQRPPQRRNDAPKAQVEQAQAAAIEDVLVVYSEDESEGAATAAEGAKMLAGKMKNATFFECETMLGRNASWLCHLPADWQKRLEAIADSKKPQTRTEA